MFKRPRTPAGNLRYDQVIFLACLTLFLLVLGAGCVPSSAVQPTTTQGLPTRTPIPTNTHLPAASPTSSPTKRAASATPEMMSTETPPAARATPLAPGAVVIVNQEGGIAGINNIWVIYKDGRIEENGTSTGNLSPKELDLVLDEIKESGFFDFEHPDAGFFCCDFFTVTITVAVDGTTHTISVSDGDTEIPADIKQVFNRLFQAIAADGT